MDNPKHDKVFYVTFLAVIGALSAITLVILAVAIAVSPEEKNEEVVHQRIDERTAPVAEVITDEQALAQLSAPAAPARAPLTGAEVVAKVCAACHTTGVLGAPKTGDQKEWARRMSASGGLDGLVKAAIVGVNAMPPRGGDPSLSDAEVRAAVQEMVK